MAAQAPVDVGLTDVLDPWLGGRLGPLLARVDARAGARVDRRGLHLRRVLRTVHVPWDRITRVHLDNRLELALTLLVDALPVTRAPVVGAALSTAVDQVADRVARRLLPGLWERSGWAVATVEQQTWRRDLDFRRSARVVALLYPQVTHRLVEECRSRGIPVMRDDGSRAGQPTT